MKKFSIGDQVIAIAAGRGDTFSNCIGKLGTVVVDPYHELRGLLDPGIRERIPVQFNYHFGCIYYDPPALRLATPVDLLALKLGAWS